MRFEQTCWNKFGTEKFAEFMSWVGDHTAESKAFVRAYIKAKGYSSCVDVGCGPATDFVGYRSEGSEILYTGIDSSWVMAGKASEIGATVLVAPIESICLPDNFADIAYCRHVLEHLPTFRDGIPELIRVARSEVLVTFFLVPGELPEKIDYYQPDNIYHNVYNRRDVEAYLASLPEVESFRWEQVGERECVLFLALNKTKETP